MWWFSKENNDLVSQESNELVKKVMIKWRKWWISKESDDLVKKVMI